MYYIQVLLYNTLWVWGWSIHCVVDSIAMHCIWALCIMRCERLILYCVVNHNMYVKSRAKTSWTADIFTNPLRDALTPTSSSALVNLRIGAVNSSPDVLGHYRSYFIIFRRRDMKIWFDIIAAKLASLIEEEFEAKTGSATSQQRHHRTSKLFQDNFTDISTDWTKCHKKHAQNSLILKSVGGNYHFTLFSQVWRKSGFACFFYSRARTEPSANVTNMTRVSL